MESLAHHARVALPEVVVSPLTQLTVYCAAVGGASLLGGAFAASFKLGHRRLQFALSFVAGTMLGVGMLHLFPHAIILAIEANGPSASHGALHGVLDSVVLATVLGFLAMFLLERFFHFHEHETREEAGHHDCCEDACGSHEGKGKGKGEGNGNGNGASHSHAPVTEIGWIGAAIGLTLHSVLEGVALAAAVLAGTSHDAVGALAGLSTFLVIVLHKPFDGLTVATLVRASGRPAGFAHVVNALFALVVPLGAAALWFGVSEDGASLLPLALAFSAGTFLCIATSDVLPELQFHRHDRVGLSLALLLGLGLAAGIARIESSVAQSHDHEHAPSVAPADGHDHDHEHHDEHDHEHDSAK